MIWTPGNFLKALGLSQIFRCPGPGSWVTLFIQWSAVECSAVVCSGVQSPVGRVTYGKGLMPDTRAEKSCGPDDPGSGNSLGIWGTV